MKKCFFLIPRMGSGGAERVMATIANNLCDTQEVRIVTLTDANCFYKLKSKVTVIGLGRQVNRKNKLFLFVSVIFGGRKAIVEIYRLIKSWKPDVLLSFLHSTNTIAILLKRMGISCRVVVSERYDPSARGAIAQWTERRFYRYADAIVCQSKAAARFFDEDTQRKIQIIPNPISADAIPPRFEGSRRKTIVGVGRLDNQKNFQMLISAFSKLPEDFRDYTLEIYGGGNQEVNLCNQIAELGLKNRVFLMGVKPNVMHYISDVALYVMSSDYEGFPNALVEAMATGLPVISTDFPTGVARDLIHEENGILIPVGDEGALVDAIQTILSNEQNWDSMSRENRKLLETLSEEKVLQLWEDALKLK